ncbi:MAG: FprA family A-type flavoprotein, partial [Lachnospiraceae bacterium]|nr:FprA family A-type flavoprotein [Lachnospiraceae bacterium]
MKISEDIFYIGVNDHKIDLFEGQYVVPNGMAYNSYVILDSRIAVMDTVDVRFQEEWLQNLEGVLDGKKPDYLIIQHMEPDHSSSIAGFLAKYPETKVVANDQAFAMMDQFFGGKAPENRVPVVNGDKLLLGHHTLTFLFAPMVHWPEVMVTYDAVDKVLFSADGFGKFGANDVEDPEGWACEARRYYFGIVGKYGQQVQALLKAAADLEIETICPLHGPVLSKNLAFHITQSILEGRLSSNVLLSMSLDPYLSLYDKWSSYTPEDEGITIAYTSVYGHTKEAALRLAELLKARNAPKVSLFDLARDDMHEAIEDAFRYRKLVLATTTYNGDIFPFMRHFIEHLTERNYQNRTVAFIENGTWAPAAKKVMQGMLSGSQNITYAKNSVTIRSALNKQSEEAL